jgi:hypothetical protein
MYWCLHCKEYVEPDYSMSYRPLGVARCPNCHLDVSGNHERPITEYHNNGIHNVTEFALPVGAPHSPTLDALLADYHILKHNETNDPTLAGARQAAFLKARAYLLEHAEQNTVVRRLG